MDLFFNVDWQDLKNIIDDINQIAYNYHQDDAKDKIELTKLFYQIEKDLASVKKQLNLPNLNSYIYSESVLKSFKKTPVDKNIFEDLIVYDDFLRQNDYQYWLLIFLLMKNNEIRQKNLTLYQIIDEFILRIKDESFTWRDIEFTGSGATRSKTNLRFAYNDLKKIGLVNLYDRRHKQSWSLTFLGFFIAASFCFDPADKRKPPFSKKITRFYQSTYYFAINKAIWERVNQLTKLPYFLQLVSRLSLDSLGLIELEKGPTIFDGYYERVSELHEGRISEKNRERGLKKYLEELNNKYPLEQYMQELSLKFDAEAFFSELIKKVNSN